MTPLPAPAVDVIQGEELLAYISPSLLDIDYTDERVKLQCIGATLIVCIFIFLLFHVLGKCCFSVYGRLRLKHQVFMSLAVVRAVYGVFGLVFGGYAIFVHSNLDRDPVYGRTATSTLGMYVTVGFFLFELSAVVISDIIFKSLSRLLILHHGLALIAYYNASHNEVNHSFGTKALILEMSTPFSCLCFALLKAGMENSLAWRINQMVLVHTFHLRSVVECHLWYLTYMRWDVVYEHMPAVPFYLLYTQLVLVTFLMTPYWGYKKTQQLFNPVDWNFQESQDRQVHSNGTGKKMI